VSSRLDEGVVAIIAAALLFVMPANWKKREFTISWDRAVRIDWGTIILFGGGLSLGKLMFSTGLAEVIGRGLTGITGASGIWGITAAVTLLAIVISETTSNTASANMVIPVAIALAKGMGVSPIPPALGACLGASFGFMLPVSTPPNAIIYGSGRVTITSMIRAGIVLDIIGFFVILTGLRILCHMLGLM
jgi:sodium-dependent dicarboxylate transporter 2/3/5